MGRGTFSKVQGCTGCPHSGASSGGDSVLLPPSQVPALSTVSPHGTNPSLSTKSLSFQCPKSTFCPLLAQMSFLKGLGQQKRNSSTEGREGHHLVSTPWTSLGPHRDGIGVIRSFSGAAPGLPLPPCSPCPSAVHQTASLRSSIPLRLESSLFPSERTSSPSSPCVSVDLGCLG